VQSALTGQSPILLARINEKKLELQNLNELRDLSAGLARQMSVLEEKLATLADGTQGRERAQNSTKQFGLAKCYWNSGCACTQ
jgi:hypothetical protein